MLGDVTAMLRDALHGDRRPPDGKLHPSGDLIGSLRHSQLRAAGAPTIESEVVGDARLMTGTLWHSYFESVWRKNRLPVMCEVRLDNWLPEGWSGTADWIAWSDEYQGFVLGDLKTIKGEGIKHVNYKGVKEEHLWQLSSYWYALEKMGLPLVKGFAVYYLPMNAPVGDAVEPMLVESDPLPRDIVLDRMNERWNATKAYLASLPQVTQYVGRPWEPRDFLSPALAEVQERIQAIRWNAKTQVWDLKLVPHWSAMFCPYPNELCDCRTQGQTKIGHYVLNKGQLEYVTRKDHEHLTPALTPDLKDVRKRAKEMEDS